MKLCPWNCAQLFPFLLTGAPRLREFPNLVFADTGNSGDSALSLHHVARLWGAGVAGVVPEFPVQGAGVGLAEPHARTGRGALQRRHRPLGHLLPGGHLPAAGKGSAGQGCCCSGLCWSGMLLVRVRALLLRALLHRAATLSFPGLIAVLLRCFGSVLQGRACSYMAVVGLGNRSLQFSVIPCLQGKQGF